MRCRCLFSDAAESPPPLLSNERKRGSGKKQRRMDGWERFLRRRTIWESWARREGRRFNFFVCKIWLSFMWMAYAPDPLLKCVLPPEIRSHFYFIISAEHSLSAKPINFLCSNSQGPFSLSLSFSQYNHSNLYAFSRAPLPSPPSPAAASPSLSPTRNAWTSFNLFNCTSHPEPLGFLGFLL